MSISDLGLYNVTIDFNKMNTYVPTNIYYKENDTDTAKIKAKLTKGGVVIDLTNTSASVEITTANSTTISESAVVSDAVNGIIDFTFPVNALIEGVNFFEIVLSENGMIKYSPRMTYKVLDSIENTGVEEETNYPILLTLIGDVNSAINEEAIRVANENTRVSDENTRIANENTRVSDEITRQTQETARQQSMTDIQNQFDALAPAESTNAEVQLARTDATGNTHTSLQERLLADNKQQSTLYADVEGAYISSDSVDGWVKDVEIKGNTIQDIEGTGDLSDIRSVGTQLSDGRYEIPLLCTGKNIFDGKLEDGHIDQTTGVPTSKNGIQTRSANFTKVNPNQLISTSNDKKISVRIYEYDKNKVYIKNQGILSDGSNFLVGGTTHYIKFVLATTITDLSIKQQLEYGTIATTYELYQEHELTILSPCQIEKIGDIADRIIEKDGIWGVEKNNVDKVLNGSEAGWSLQTSSEGYMRFALIVTDDTTSSNDIISDKFNKADVNGNNAFECIFKASNKAVHIIIKTDKLATQDIAGFKAWLSNNNTLIKYQATNPQFIPLADDQQVALRTFANKTNILSLCEIEPTVKGSVPKSTSASINSINEHLKNVDSEMERIKKIEDATTSTVITDKSFVNIVDSTNGYLSDLKLEGRTLVNKIDKTKFNNSLVLQSSNNRWKYVDFDNLDKLKLNTEYTLIWFNSLNNYPIKVSGLDSMMMATLNPIELMPNIPIKHKFTDLNIIKFSGYLDFAKGWTGTENVDDIKNKCKLLVLEGDYTQNPPNGYFEGLKSVGDGTDKLVVSSVNENLFDGEIEIGGLSTVDGTPIGADGIRSKDFTFLHKGNYYISANNDKSLRVDIFIFDLNKSFVKREALANQREIIIENNCYIKIYDNASIQDVNANIMLSLSDISYIERQSDEKEILYLDTVDDTWKKPTLRGKWENDELVWGDTIEKHADGKYYYHKRCDEVVFNGSESWSYSNADETTKKRFYTDINGVKIRSDAICDKFNAVDYSNFNSSNEAVFISSTPYFNLNIEPSKLSTQDVTGFKAWLYTNNVTVVYELAQEQVYECTPIDVASFDGETNYYNESGVLSPKSTVRCANYIGNVVNNLKEQVSILQAKNITNSIMLLNHEARLIAHGI